MPTSRSQQLDALSDYLAARRDAILQAWRDAAKADPEQTTARSLTQSQFLDHIPEVLDAFQRKLCSRPGGANARAADAEKKLEEVKHGLHRWQQGYRLLELMHEWGHLQSCLFEEVAAYAKAHPEFDQDALAEANRQMIALVNEAIGESANQYERMQKAEAASRLNDLQLALASVSGVERRRAILIHQAVHDLRSDVHSVSMAAEVLRTPDIPQPDREEFTSLLQQGAQAVGEMLRELMELARLEAGQEKRKISAFDATALIVELCELNQPLARERGLYLNPEGPDRLNVVGDPGKVRRLLKNLLFNALKYTSIGGVTVSWGEEKEHWWLMVSDTGPGILAGPGAPLLAGLEEATASAREADEKSAEAEGEVSQVLSPTSETTPDRRPEPMQAGEGIGLSIVKRLCELLDASLELSSSAESGSTFRIVFPRRYPGAGS